MTAEVSFTSILWPSRLPAESALGQTIADQATELCHLLGRLEGALGNHSKKTRAHVELEEVARLAEVDVCGPLVVGLESGGIHGDAFGVGAKGLGRSQRGLFSEGAARGIHNRCRKDDRGEKTQEERESQRVAWLGDQPVDTGREHEWAKKHKDDPHETGGAIMVPSGANVILRG